VVISDIDICVLLLSASMFVLLVPAGRTLDRAP